MVALDEERNQKDQELEKNDDGIHVYSILTFYYFFIIS